MDENFFCFYQTELKRCCRRRSLEIQKVAKRQIELVSVHFRNKFFVEAFCQIKRNPEGAVNKRQVSIDLKCDSN